jgi:hypothetical protein
MRAHRPINVSGEQGKSWTVATGWRQLLTRRSVVLLAGYAGAVREAVAAPNQLEINVVLLQSEESQLLMVSLDVLFAGPAIVRAARMAASEAGLSDVEVVVLASHTHGAPATDVSKPRLGAVVPEVLDEMCIQVEAAVRDALTADRQPARVLHGSATTNLNVNRRVFRSCPTLTRRGVRRGPVALMAPNPSGARDPSIDLLRFVGLDGRLLAVAWKFGCHPVGRPPQANVSADFPGRVRERLRESVGATVPVVFMQGFSGDVRPAIGLSTTWGERVVSAVTGPRFGVATETEWDAWANELSAEVFSVFRNAHVEIVGNLRLRRTKIPLEEIVDGRLRERQSPHDLDVRIASIGNALEVLFVSAEVCAPFLERVAHDLRTIAVGCVDHCFGYFPVEAQRREGGYEAEGFLEYFSVEGAVRVDAESRLVLAVSALRSRA